MDSELLQFCLLIAVLFSAVILLALAAKLVEVYRARNWLTTTGTVTESKVQARKRQTMDEGTRFESEPRVTYEYEVGGKRYRASRISFGEHIGGADVMPTLARYAVGNEVQVYYNPTNPEEAILERELPLVVAKGVAVLILFFFASAILVPVALTVVSASIAPVLPNPDRAFMVTMLGAMAVFALLIALAIQRQVWAAKGWKVASGRILSSDVEAYQKWTTVKGRSRLQTFFRPSIVYAFEVDGQQFISDQVSFGGQISWSSPRFSQQGLARYPEGSAVSVYYDPQNPTDSVLERRGSGVILLVIITAGLLGLALVVAR